MKIVMSGCNLSPTANDRNNNTSAHSIDETAVMINDVAILIISRILFQANLFELKLDLILMKFIEIY